GAFGSGILIDDFSGGNLTPVTGGQDGRIGDAATITLAGGTLSYIGSGGAATKETVGQLIVNAPVSGTNTIQSTAGASGQQLIFDNPVTGMTRAAGASVNFVGINGDIG